MYRRATARPTASRNDYGVPAPLALPRLSEVLTPIAQASVPVSSQRCNRCQRRADRTSLATGAHTREAPRSTYQPQKSDSARVWIGLHRFPEIAFASVDLGGVQFSKRFAFARERPTLQP